MKSLTQEVQDGAVLSPDQIAKATDQILDESVDAAEKADFLAALAQRGETASEIAGFASLFLDRAVVPPLDKSSFTKPLLDVCGTGGDKLDLFNVSTTSVFVLAGADVAVVKHGNRGITSKSGGADVLEALGIRIDLPPEDFCRCVEQVGAGFLFAPLYHPAFKAVVPVRKMLAERGQRTIFNLLGPLLNPVRPDYQLIGVFDEEVGGVFADILGKLGRSEAWAVHGKTESGAGMDELSVLGETQIWTTPDTASSRAQSPIRPDSLGIDMPSGGVSELQGGDAEENAKILEGILDGSIKDAKRDIVRLNAAAGLTITGKTENLAAGLELASEVIDSGKALDVLRKWQKID